MQRLTVNLDETTYAALTSMAARDERTLSKTAALILARAVSSTTAAGPAPRAPVVPIGGQDAAAGAGVEARREKGPSCGKGKHPPGSRIGDYCGACGDAKAWAS